MKLLDGIEGIVYLIDDVLVHGQTQEEHNLGYRGSEKA